MVEYGDIVFTTKQQKTDIKDIKKRTENLQKRNLEDEITLDELEQYDKRQNLESQGVPFKDDENVTDITLDLVNKLGVD